MGEGFVTKRLLLAKEFFLHAVERSYRTDAINKMMAIHNFHIAVEIVLRAILLKNAIRTEKSLNIDFESMMSEIDKHIQKKIPYRQELRSLNALRGLIQHQALEPHETSMEEFRVITNRFLNAAYETYFGVRFTELSRISMVADATLRELLERSQTFLSGGQLVEAATYVLAAFRFSSASVVSFLPNEGFNSSFFINSRLDHAGINIKPITQAFHDTYKRIRQGEKLAAVLGSGVALSDLKRLESLPLHLSFSMTGAPLVQLTSGIDIDPAHVEWAIEFVTSCIILWQQHGIEPYVEEDEAIGAKALLELSGFADA